MTHSFQSKIVILMVLISCTDYGNQKVVEPSLAELHSKPYPMGFRSYDMAFECCRLINSRPIPNEVKICNHPEDRDECDWLEVCHSPPLGKFIWYGWWPLPDVARELEKLPEFKDEGFKFTDGKYPTECHLLFESYYK